MRRSALPLLLAALAGTTAQARDGVPVQGYRVVHVYPHDRQAYTEGLFHLDGYLYESTGEQGGSSIRKVELDSGRVLQQANLPPPYYGEGIVAWHDRLLQLTWRNQQGFVYDLSSFQPTARFSYTGEGWALTSDATHLYMSDGSSSLRILDPDTLAQTGTLPVTVNGRPLENLNELEWVKGEIYANVWLTDRIARIDPASGKVLGWIDLSGLAPPASELADPGNDVLNGIAYDARADRLFVTGKRWPHLYEIRLAAPPR